MKLCSFTSGGRDRVGVAVSDTEVAEINARDMIEVIEKGLTAPTKNRHAISDLRWL